LLTDLLTGTIPKTAGVAPLPSIYEATFELVRKRPEPYREALRLLLDTSFDDARERWGAMRRLNAEMEAVWTELEAGPFRRRQRKR